MDPEELATAIAYWLAYKRLQDLERCSASSPFANAYWRILLRQGVEC